MPLCCESPTPSNQPLPSLPLPREKKEESLVSARGASLPLRFWCSSHFYCDPSHPQSRVQPPPSSSFLPIHHHHQQPTTPRPLLTAAYSVRRFTVLAISGLDTFQHPPEAIASLRSRINPPYHCFHDQNTTDPNEQIHATVHRRHTLNPTGARESEELGVEQRRESLPQIAIFNHRQRNTTSYWSSIRRSINSPKHLDLSRHIVHCTSTLHIRVLVPIPITNQPRCLVPALQSSRPQRPRPHPRGRLLLHPNASTSASSATEPSAEVNIAVVTNDHTPRSVLSNA
jgi:hypothetical protein